MGGGFEDIFIALQTWILSTKHMDDFKRDGNILWYKGNRGEITEIENPDTEESLREEYGDDYEDWMAEDIVRYVINVYDDEVDILYGHVYLGDLEDAEIEFVNYVEESLNMQRYCGDTFAWERKNDFRSVSNVMSCQPDEFLRRIREDNFDKSLLVEVPGGDYEVPVWYATKAWDFILKGETNPFDYYLGPSSKNYSPEEIAKFQEENQYERLLDDAIADNDRMKQIWKEQFGINIDAFELDFSIFGKNLPPKVTEKEYRKHFWRRDFNLHEGVFKAAVMPISFRAGCNSISDLMETAAEITAFRSGAFFPSFIEDDDPYIDEIEPQKFDDPSTDIG